MAKKRTQSQPFGGPAAATGPAAANTISSQGKRPVNWSLVALFLFISIGGCYLWMALRPEPKLPRYTYQVLRTFDHDPDAFTQGLVVDDGYLWESTGRKGKSSVRKVVLETGEVLINKPLGDEYFGEGLTVLDDKFYQVTWQSNVGFVYDRDLNQIDQFKYDGQGWGLATDGTHLFMSDGTPQIRVFDPDTFEQVRSIWVRRAGARVGQLNELEMFGLKPKLYANRFMSDLVYEIDPETGDVTAEIDLTGLWPKRERPEGGVLNGIAIHPESKKMLVTGKLCPKVYEIQLLKEDD